MKWNISLILFCIAYLGVISNAQSNGDLRLTERSSGQLEVYFNGWGFICDDSWSIVEANTTCKILGYGTAVTTTTGQYNASTNYKLNRIECIGNENSILDCGHATVFITCSTSDHIYIECGYVNGDVRLTEGDSGLVEVYYNGWGFICDDEWDTVDSTTLCHILGYSTAISTTTGSFHSSRNYKLNSINCRGGEFSILDCDYQEYTPNHCSQDQHIYVFCVPANGDLRLTGGSSGQLEVYYNGWGFICDDRWNGVDADIACKILGYDMAIATITGIYNPVSNYKLIHIGCRGNESSVLDCSYSLYSSFRSSFCSAYEHIYIECGPVNGDLRLTEGSRGQLEVYFNGWGFICDDGWSIVDANTTCKILGYGTAVNTTLVQYNASTNYRLNYIDCIGNEISILDCGHRTYVGGTYCSPSEHIYIECRYANGELRLTGGSSGQLEVYYDGWGFICDDEWNDVDADTACKILGYDTAITTTIGAYNSTSNYKLINIGCRGTESNILDCSYALYSSLRSSYCSVDEHIYIECGPEQLPSPIQPTLVDRDAVSIEIEWEEYLFPVLHYSLCVTKSNEFGCNNDFTTSNTSFLIQDLEPGTEYFVTVSALTHHGLSPKSNRTGFTTGLSR